MVAALAAAHGERLRVSVGFFEGINPVATAPGTDIIIQADPQEELTSLHGRPEAYRYVRRQSRDVKVDLLLP